MSVFTLVRMGKTQGVEKLKDTGSKETKELCVGPENARGLVL